MISSRAHWLPYHVFVVWGFLHFSTLDSCRIFQRILNSLWKHKLENNTFAREDSLSNPVKFHLQVPFIFPGESFSYPNREHSEYNSRRKNDFIQALEKSWNFRDETELDSLERKLEVRCAAYFRQTIKQFFLNCELKTGEEVIFCKFCKGFSSEDTYFHPGSICNPVRN